MGQSTKRKVVSGRRPVWERALELLHMGEREGAKALLGGVEYDAAGAPTQDLLDRWVAALLSRAIDPHADVPMLAAPPAFPAPNARTQETLAVGQALQAILEARAAVSSGRVEDLVRFADVGTDRAPAEWPWIGFQAAAVLQAAFRFSGEPAVFERAVESCRALADRLDVPHVAVPARALLGSVYLLTGQFHRTLDHCDAAIALAEATGLSDDVAVALAHQFRGYVLFEWQQLAEARAALERAWGLTDTRHAGVRSGVARVMSGLMTALGDREGAARWLRRLEAVVKEPMTLRNREWLAAVRARHGLASQRDLRTLDAWRHTYDYYSEPLEALSDARVGARLHEYEHLLTMLEATGQWQSLLDIAAVVLRGSGPLRNWFHVRALFARAVALDALGRQGEADDACSEALSLGEEGSFVRVYFDGSPVRLQVLRRALTREEARGPAERVFAAIPDIATGESAMSLTRRQVDVLREVAHGHSNTEIADRLGISLPTVKTHLQGIFARLGVKSRTAAVVEGRRIGVVEQ